MIHFMINVFTLRSMYSLYDQLEQCHYLGLINYKKNVKSNRKFLTVMTSEYCQMFCSSKATEFYWIILNQTQNPRILLNSKNQIYWILEHWPGRHQSCRRSLGSPCPWCRTRRTRTRHRPEGCRRTRTTPRRKRGACWPPPAPLSLRTAGPVEEAVPGGRGGRVGRILGARMTRRWRSDGTYPWKLLMLSELLDRKW